MLWSQRATFLNRKGDVLEPEGRRKTEWRNCKSVYEDAQKRPRKQGSGTPIWGQIGLSVPKVVLLDLVADKSLNNGLSRALQPTETKIQASSKGRCSSFQNRFDRADGKRGERATVLKASSKKGSTNSRPHRSSWPRSFNDQSR